MQTIWPLAWLIQSTPLVIGFSIWTKLYWRENTNSSSSIQNTRNHARHVCCCGMAAMEWKTGVHGPAQALASGLSCQLYLLQQSSVLCCMGSAKRQPLTNDNGGVAALVDLPVLHIIEALVSTRSTDTISHQPQHEPGSIFAEGVNVHRIFIPSDFGSPSLP